MSNPYSYIFDSASNAYQFCTRNNITYKIVFVADATFSTIANEEIPGIFQIVVEKVENIAEPLDPNVSKTIEHIIESFFKRVENALIYICSDGDKKAAKRFRVFDRWYQQSPHKQKIVKMDNIIHIDIDENEMETLYTSFLFHKSNPNYKKLIAIYKQIEKVLNEEK